MKSAERKIKNNPKDSSSVNSCENENQTRELKSCNINFDEFQPSSPSEWDETDSDKESYDLQPEHHEPAQIHPPNSDYTKRRKHKRKPSNEDSPISRSLAHEVKKYRHLLIGQVYQGSDKKGKSITIRIYDIAKKRLRAEMVPCLPGYEDWIYPKIDWHWVNLNPLDSKYLPLDRSKVTAILQAKDGNGTPTIKCLGAICCLKPNPGLT